MNKTALILLLAFSWNLCTGQFSWTQNSGTINYNSSLSSSHMHFYIFDDGYYRKQMHPSHFYSSGPHTTTLYEIDNKQSDDPFDHIKSIAVDPHGTATPSPHTPLRINGSAEAKPSWNITYDFYGMILLEFQNDFSSTPSSGCLELIYDPGLLSVSVNPDPRAWANLVSHQNGVISWTYTNLQPDEQRVLYLDTNANIPGKRNYTLTATISDNCTSPRTTVTKHTTHSVPHDPNNKVVTNTDFLAETWQLEIPIEQVPQEVVYRINFHNDGENFAQNVSIFDNIHPKADPSSIQFVGSSHPCTFDVNWNLLEVNFDDIYLPGANQNDPERYTFDETIGYFEYSICIPQRINPSESLETQAEIYFDSIGPVSAYNSISAFDTQPHENFCEGNISDKITNTGESQLSHIRIYPNPAGHHLFIEGLEEETEINIYNQSGMRIPVDMTGTFGQIQLNIEKLNQGFYILEINTTDSTRFEKFIKQ